jgi:predicted nucleic acid-binding protein
MSGSLEVTTFLLYEFRQAIRFQIRLYNNDKTKGYNKSEGKQMFVNLENDLAKRFLEITPVSWPQVHARAERLSERYTEVHGYRSMDILHVATALEGGAKEFLTFDKNQGRLAEAEGLTVPFETVF